MTNPSRRALIFGKPLRTGRFHTEKGGASVEYTIEKVPSGHLVTGTIRGRLGTVEILRTELPRRMMVNNWQSWGPTHVVESDSRGSYAPADIPPHRRHMFSPIPDLSMSRLTSDYFVATERLLNGFLASRIAHPYFAAEEGELAGYLEYFDTVQEEAIPIEPLIIIEGEPPERSLPSYSSAVARENGVSINAWNPVGWSSWYCYFTALTWADVEKNLLLARGKFPFEVFQIDDSYQLDIGDWQSKQGFPPPGVMAKAIAASTFTPGIWTAPFSASETSRLFRDHPDWFVLSGGSPALCYRGWEKDIYALDTSDAEVKNWLDGTFTRLRKGGFPYHKIDFLFAGAMTGDRKRSLTPIQAYREGLSVIRQALGRGFILGCGAPLLPSVGFVDAMRISEDTAPFWKPELSPYHGPNAYHALKNTILRQFMHRRLWLNDPDCVMLRTRNTELTPGIITMYALVSGLLDTMIFESDDLSIVTEEERQLLARLLKLRGGDTSVEGLFNDDHYCLRSVKKGLPTVSLGVNLSGTEHLIGGQRIPPASAALLNPAEAAI